MNLTGVTSIDPAASKATFSEKSLGQEDFMRLLLEELNHQDPMKPMDSKEFTVQLTQFSSLEGINDINTNLNNLLTFQQSMQNATVTNMIGKTVTVDGNSTHLNGSANMSYDLAEDAVKVNVTIRDDIGKVVRIVNLDAQEAGSSEYIWDGKDDMGNQLVDGSYTFEVDAVDEAGDYIPVSTTSAGHVSGISFENGMTYLVLDGTKRVYLSEIKTIEE